MKIIYHCYGGSHSSVVAAAIHLGLLDRERAPGIDELMSLDLFDKTTPEQHGVFHHFGTDERGNEVYSVGLRNQGANITRTLRGFCDLYGVAQGDVLFVNTLDCVNWRMRLGGWLSRAAGRVALGRPIVLAGLRQAYAALCAKVRNVKRRVREAGVARTDRMNPGRIPVSRSGSKVLYFCYGGTHSSVACAAYHMGRLPHNRPPRLDELFRVPYFDRVPTERLGELHYWGVDEDGTAVLTVGFGSARPLGERAVRSFLEVCLGAVPGDVVFCDCLELAGPWIRLGGVISRRMGLTRIGRYIVAVALRTRWQTFAALARKTQLAGRPGRVT